jgi:FolB domain-containing protein
MDTINIKDLALRTIIGIYPEERREKQDILINITLETDLKKAGETDDIANTVDYKDLKKKIIRFAEESHCNLIESLAENIAAICLLYSGVKRALVTVDKPNALRFARSVSVTVDRQQKK